MSLNDATTIQAQGPTKTIDPIVRIAYETSRPICSGRLRFRRFLAARSRASVAPAVVLVSVAI
jgi:hypothetical protein